LKNKSLKNQKSSIDFFIETPKPSLVERLSDYLKGRGDSVKVIRTLLLLGALLGISALTLQSSMGLIGQVKKFQTIFHMQALQLTEGERDPESTEDQVREQAHHPPQGANDQRDERVDRQHPYQE
jgi:hypothetical protein